MLPHEEMQKVGLSFGQMSGWAGRSCTQVNAGYSLFEPQEAPHTRMSNTNTTGLNPILRVDFPPAERLGRGKITLLEHIRETGSISAAGRAMDMSYRRAWLLVSALNRMFTQDAVESQRGGKQGGGAVVTPFGEELIRRFRAMEEKLDAALATELAWLEENRNPNASTADRTVTDPERHS
jgi:molybdate transport system regulatory protein